MLILYTGGPPLTRKSLTRFPLPRFLAYVVGEEFFGTGIEIWAEFGPVWQLLRPGFSCFYGQKKILKTF